jgi:peptidoglycan hydrolase-like protein with peptidoglycan-binding domain
MVKPPTTRKIEIPAVYKTVRVKKMVSPPEKRTIQIPAEYQTITKTEKTSEGRMAWRQILCETNVSSGLITKVQMSLQRAGYNPGPIDGILGSRTRAAMKAYQQNKGLAEGELTYETIKSLGIKL